MAATTAWLNEKADAVLDAAIQEIETPVTRVLKGEFLSAHLIKSLWGTLPTTKQATLLKKYPEIKEIVNKPE